MLDHTEFKHFDKALHALETILCQFPQVSEVKRVFDFSGVEQSDPLQFICKGDNGGYVLEFSPEFLKDRLEHVDLMGSVLQIQTIEQHIYPTSDWKCYRFTSSSGIEEVHKLTSSLSHIRTKVVCAD